MAKIEGWLAPIKQDTNITLGEKVTIKLPDGSELEI